MNHISSGVCQDFDISLPIISYICNNPLKSADFFYKLYSTCKYFYPKMKIIPCKGIDNNTYEEPVIKFISPLSNLFNNNKKYFYKITFLESQISLLNFKVFCNKAIFHISFKENENGNPKLISYFFKKLFWHCSNSAFTISGQILTLDDYKLLAEASTISLSLKDVTVTNLDGTTFIPVEELLRIGKNIKNFSFSSRENYDKYYTNETAQNLASFLRPKKFVHFYLRELPANFDATAFSTFIKKNSEIPESYINLKFNENVPHETVFAFFQSLTTELGKENIFDDIQLNGIRFAKFCGGNAFSEIFAAEILNFVLYRYD